jgi:hypothetical protein
LLGDFAALAHNVCIELGFISFALALGTGGRCFGCIMAIRCGDAARGLGFVRNDNGGRQKHHGLGRVWQVLLGNGEDEVHPGRCVLFVDDGDQSVKVINVLSLCSSSTHTISRIGCLPSTAARSTCQVTAS